jgi:hypothetical protein
MKRFLKKLLVGNKETKNLAPTNALLHRVNNIKAIWNNHHQDDIGIEKIFRLFLAASSFLFLGIYIKNYFGRKGPINQDLSIDLFVIFKLLFPLSLVIYNWIPNPYALILVIWFLIETFLYVPILIFASDSIAKPSSYRRSMLLLFFNYFEIAFSYAFLYGCGNHFNKPFTNWYDSIYFSFTTLSSIGFGDYYPITGIGKFLVCTQSTIFLAFVVLFINFFSNKVLMSEKE